MKDYSFGNYICALRTGLGLSQFQLGTLVGVTDKAVSKWENGDAKPRIGTCYRLAEVLGVTVNELLSCNTTLPARKELDNMKRKLWNEAQKRLSIFGDVPPVLCWSRLAAEKAAVKEEKSKAKSEDKKEEAEEVAYRACKHSKNQSDSYCGHKNVILNEQRIEVFNSDKLGEMNHIKIRKAHTLPAFTMLPDPRLVFFGRRDHGRNIVFPA